MGFGQGERGQSETEVEGTGAERDEAAWVAALKRGIDARPSPWQQPHRWLERCGHFAPSHGGGSITALALLATDDSTQSDQVLDRIASQVDTMLRLAPDAATMFSPKMRISLVAFCLHARSST